MPIPGKHIMRRTALALTLLAVLGPAPALAGSAWDEIRPSVFGNRAIEPAGAIIELNAPFRPLDQRAVPIEVNARFTDGRTIRAVTIILDENPTPVAARFDMGEKRDAVHLAANMRLNAATDVRAIVEASDGQLYMAQRFVKFAGGQAACAAPPSGTPQEIAANMGKMTFEPVAKKVAASEIAPRARLKIGHPNHTGMVLDQLTLLYIPLRIITTVDVRQGEERVFTLTGSIAMSQNPQVEFDYRTNGAEKMHVEAVDSAGASWARDFPIGQGS
jgi:sulfur-oxidizing protein SoxY